MIFVLLALLFAPILQRKAHSGTRKIIVIQSGKIGDFVCSTPLFRGLREAFPAARIVLVTHPANLPLARQLPFFDQFIEVPSGSLKGLSNRVTWIRCFRELQADLAVCCSGGAAWPAILALAGIPRRLGVTPNFLGRSTRLAQGLWTDRAMHDGNQLIGSTYARLLGLLDIQTNPDKELRASPGAPVRLAEFMRRAGVPEDGALLAGIAISSANKLKELGRPLLEDICRELLAADPRLHIVFLGGPGDQAQAAALAATLASSRVFDSCGQFALDEVPALLRRLAVFIGVDSGLTYMADALKIPLVSIAGPCNMNETRPVNEHAVILQEKLPCVPCAHIFKAPYSCHLGTRACIARVQSRSVVDAALAALFRDGK